MTTFFGHLPAENFQNDTFPVAVEVDNGQVVGEPQAVGGFPIGETLVAEITRYVEIRLGIPGFIAPDTKVVIVDAIADTSVDYHLSPDPIVIDMEVALQHGGFAEGDTLVNIFEITGTGANDILRGMDDVNNVANDPGDNVLNGGGGNDLLEGRGGADTLNGGGGDGFDFASYESSPAAVTVRLADNAQTAIATGGDATGDTFSSIEGLIGSRFNDTLTGNSLDNVLAGGLGSDTLDGKDGIDTVDYSRDHFLDPFTTADRVEVHLGLNGASGTGTEFRLALPDNFFTQVSVDRLFSIENVTGTANGDTIVGNERDNILDGRNGDDTLDGGFGNDVLIGGVGNDTASFASHDSVTGQIATISLGLNGADGQATQSIRSQVIESDVLRGIENVIGSNQSERINGNEKDNTLAGRGGNDIMRGGAGNDTYDFTGPTGVATGSDQIFDTSGTADRLLVNSFSGIFASRDGNDLVVSLPTGSVRIVDHFNGHAVENIATVGGTSMVLATGNIGGNGSGIIAGGNGGETLDGRGGDDFLFGGNGSDRLIGGDGNDRLTGGNGGDTFVFGPGFGHDEITDFTDADRIEFNGGQFRNFQAVQAASQRVGNDTVITLDPNDSITLQDVALKSLRASHFSFVPAASPGPSTGAASAAPLPNIALLGSYMASTFVGASDGHGSSVVADPAAFQGVQPLVTLPHA